MLSCEEKLKIFYTNELNNHIDLMKYYFNEIKICKNKMYKLSRSNPFILSGATNEKIQIAILYFIDYYYFLEKSIYKQKYKIQIDDPNIYLRTKQHHIRTKMCVLEDKCFLIMNEMNQYKEILVEN